MSGVLICFKCTLRIPDYKYQMIPLERPYMNLFFHVDCYRQIESMPEYLKENSERIFDYEQPPAKTNKNR